jgi:two-component system OmpR family response regulator
MRIESVLLVDDDPDIRRVAEISLGTVGGWTTFTAISGDDALRLSATQPVDVIVLDMMMPGRDGLSTLAALRATPQTAHTPVVFMTAKVQRSEVQTYIDAGADGVIAKPFDPMTLPDELRRVVASLGDIA